MKTNWYRSALMLLLVGAPAGLCRAESFEEVEKKIKDAYEKVNSGTAKMDMVSEMGGEGFQMSQKMTGTYAFMRKDGTVMMRSEMDSDVVQKMMGQETKQHMRSLMVSDGDVVYSLNDVDGQKTATKSKAQPEQMPWDGMKEDNELTVLEDAKVDGKDAYVIQAIQKGRAEGDQSRALFYCLKDCGMMAKTVMYDEKGKDISTMTMSDIKINVDVPADQFKFTLPEGVEVMELPGQ